MLTHYGTISDYDTGLNMKRIVQFFAFSFSSHNEAVSLCLIAVTVLLIGMILVRSKKPEFFWVFLLNPVWVGILCILSSFLFHKFITGRYLLPGWGAFWAGLAIGTSHLKKNWFLPVLAVIDLLSCIFIYQTEATDRKAMDDLLAYTETHQPMYAETDVRNILVYLNPELDLIEDNDPSTTGERLVYRGSDLYFQLSESNITMTFPLTVHKICVFSN